MIKPVKMKKINAVILEDKKDAVLRELKELGAIHFLKIQDSDIAEDLKLSPGRTSGINVRASEYLSKVEGMLDVFKLIKDEDTTALQALTKDPAPPVGTTEVSPEELFRKAEEKVSALEGKITGVSVKLEALNKETDDIQSAREVMEKLKPLGVSPVDLKDFNSTFTATGLVATEEIGALRNDIEKVTDLVFIQSKERTKKDSVIIIVASRDIEADIKRIMHIHRFEEFHVPEAFAHYSQDDAESKIGSRLVEIETEKSDLLAELKGIKDAEEKDLLILHESLQIEKLMDETNTYFGNTQRAFLLKGWIPGHMAKKIVDAIETSSENNCVVTTEDPHHHEEPPTLLENSNMAKPIEMLTETYGTPTYDMMDPSLMMTITFPMIFGLMFGDVGQGLFLVLMGGTLGFVLKVDQAVKKLGRVIMYCGIAAMCGGIIYGEFFGLHFAVVPILSSIYPEGGIDLIGSGAAFYLQSKIIEISLPFHPIESVMNLIVLAFFIAIAHVSLGCMIKISDEIAHGKPLHAIVSPWGVMGLWLFWGGAMVLITNGVSGTIEHIMNILKFDMDAIKALGPTIIFPAAMIAIGGKFVEGLSPAWAIYEAYEAVSRYLFNSLSYVRIAALAVVHAVFALLMNMGLNGVTGMSAHPPHTVAAQLDAMAGAGPMLILWIMIFIAGNAIIIILETLISFIHTLRLHYYEWFSKFYEGGGSSFKPFLALRKYTFLVPSYTEDK